MNIIKQGDTGSQVKKIQAALGLTADGIYGEKTTAAVIKFQKQNGLVADGIVGPATAKLLLKETSYLRDNKELSTIRMSYNSNSVQAILKSIRNYGNLVNPLAKKLLIEPATAHAVIAVESAGTGMYAGKPVIRFENHHFYNKWGKYNQDFFFKYWNFDRTKPWEQHTFCEEKFHGNQELEWKSFLVALDRDQKAAIESTSFGLGQILGRHWVKLGFKSAQDFYNYQCKGERQQLLSMFDLIASNAEMLTALQEKDWYTFTYHYNGSGQVDIYSAWLLKRYNLAKTILDILK